MKQPALWFSTYYGEYISRDPAFFMPAEINVAADLELNAPGIINELKILWETPNDMMDKYGDYSTYDDVQFPPGGWKKLVFRTWNLNNKFMWNKFPVTASVIKHFPEVTSCFVTKLTQNTTLRLHHGETNATFRIHLGLHVPSENIDVCGFEVKGEKIKWENEKAFAFIDAHSHRAWNHSATDRYVLLVDVIRPEFKRYRNYVCAKVIFSHIVSGAGRVFNMPALFKKGLPFGNVIFILLYLPILIGIKINNTFNVIKF